MERTEREDKQKAKIRVHTYVLHTCIIPVPGTSHDTWYCVFQRKHSAARHSTAPQGTALHGAALRAAEL